MLPDLGQVSLEEKVNTLLRGQLALHAEIALLNERVEALEGMVVYEEGEADDTSGSE